DGEGAAVDSRGRDPGRLAAEVDLRADEPIELALAVPRPEVRGRGAVLGDLGKRGHGDAEEPGDLTHEQTCDRGRLVLADESGGQSLDDPQLAVSLARLLFRLAGTP